MANSTKIEAKIDQLAELMVAGFDRLENKMDQKFEDVDRRFERVDKRFEQIDNRFEQVDKRFDTLENKANRSEVRLDGVESQITGIKDTQDKHTRTLHRIEEDVELLLHHDLQHEKRIVRLEKDNRQIKEGLSMV